MVSRFPATGKFVVSIPDESTIEPVQISAVDYALLHAACTDHYNRELLAHATRQDELFGLDIGTLDQLFVLGGIRA